MKTIAYEIVEQLGWKATYFENHLLWTSDSSAVLVNEQRNAIGVPNHFWAYHLERSARFELSGTDTLHRERVLLR